MASNMQTASRGKLELLINPLSGVAGSAVHGMSFPDPGDSTVNVGNVRGGNVGHNNGSKVTQTQTTNQENKQQQDTKTNAQTGPVSVAPTLNSNTQVTASPSANSGSHVNGVTASAGATGGNAGATSGSTSGAISGSTSGATSGAGATVNGR